MDAGTIAGVVAIVVAGLVAAVAVVSAVVLSGRISRGRGEAMRGGRTYRR